MVLTKVIYCLRAEEIHTERANDQVLRRFLATNHFRPSMTSPDYGDYSRRSVPTTIVIRGWPVPFSKIAWPGLGCGAAPALLASASTRQHPVEAPCCGAMVDG